MTDTRPVIMGMNNPYGANPEMALYPAPATSTGGRLLRFSDLDKRTYLRVFDRRNLLTGEWTMARAREVRESTRLELLGRTVVLLGAPVNSIMRGGTEHELAPPFRWTPDGHGGWMARVPHPSGLNTFYNDTVHQTLLAIFMQELAQ